MIAPIISIPPTEAQSLSRSRTEDQKSQFLQLLIAQLKGQDPMNPMEGTEFVTQLAQFSSLEELIGIRESLEELTGIREVMKKVEQHLTPREDTGSDAAEFFA